jgi:hypothetical protein
MSIAVFYRPNAGKDDDKMMLSQQEAGTVKHLLGGSYEKREDLLCV